MIGNSVYLYRFFQAFRWKVCEACLKFFVVQKTIGISIACKAEISLFGLGEKAIPIYIPAKRPRLGTIRKNHIQSSSIFSRTALLLSALNLILSLRIISSLE